MVYTDRLKNFEANIDIKKTVAVRPFFVTDGDTGNVLTLNVYDGQQSVDLSGCFVNAVFIHKRGISAQDSEDGSVSVLGNVVTIRLAPSSFSPGLVECELQIYSGETDGEPSYETLVTTARFSFTCRNAILNGDAIVSSTQFPALTRLIDSVTSAEEARVSAENARAGAEAERAAAETARAAAETGRASAETERSTDTAAAISGADTAAAHAESAAGSIAQLYYPTGSSMGTITKGYTINLSGVSKQHTKRARTDIKSRIYGAAIRRLAVSLDLEGYEYAIALYGSPAQLDGTGWIGYQSNAAWLTGKTIISPTAANFALAFRHTVNGTEQAITDADVTAISESLVVYAATDMDLTEAGVPADAKATGDRLGLFEDASLHWISWLPNLEQKRITDDGGIYTSADNYQVHTKSLWNGRMDNAAVRYAVKMTDTTYQFRVASYGENGSYGAGGVGVDFNGFVNAWTTGTVVLPANCRKFGVVFKKASGEQTQVGTDGAAIKAALSVQVATDETLSISGRAADAKAVRALIAPELTASQKQDILDLVDAYYAMRENVVYRFVTTRNSFASKETTFDENNKLQLCCTAFTQLIWGGVDPSTFADPATYDGTIVKAFDWGYFLNFRIRQRTDGLAIRENGVVTGEYGYRSTNGYEHGWSFNSRYDANGTWPNSQKPRTALNASDIACELFNNGYEIPLRYADVGDMVFYEEIPSGMNEYYSNAFRRIDHGSIVIGKRDGFLEVAEVTSINGGNPPVLKRSIFSEDDFLAAKSGYMASRIVMVARHPAAFGVAGNVPNKFTTVNGRY